jgi:cyclohexa-1,5-dienecarbonyl-CoA hydratase
MQKTKARALRDERLDNGRIAHWILAAGRGNVIDLRLLDELEVAIVALQDEERVSALLIDHEGPDFSFGASVAEHLPGQVERMLPALHAFARNLVDLSLPTIACVRGRCLGGGLELAALADRIVASPDARFAQPEVNLGVFAPIGSLVLPRWIGAARASELLLTGRTIDAVEAHAIGLVTEITADPTASAAHWVRAHLLSKSAEALHFATRAARLAWSETFRRELGRLESIYLDELVPTHDATEGIRAFLEKREPRWSHA